MFFVLSKILYYVVMPVFWILLLMGVALFAKKPKLKRWSLGIAFGLLLLFSNPLLVNEAWRQWEVPATPLEQVKEYEVGVVLTGVTNLYRKPHDRVYFNKGADRILHALQLYRMGKIRKFLITGGSGSVSRGLEVQESDELRKVLLLAQVPDSVIILENKSRNTNENALFTADMLQQMGHTEPVLLITSAFHMRRSAGCFRKRGVQFDTFSTDFYSIDRGYYTLDNLVVPKEEALYHWQKLIHESLGYITYGLMGYL